MSKYGIQNGYFSNTINIGQINEAQDAFIDKEDHTDAAIYAVATHVLHKHGGKYVGSLGTHDVEISVTPRNETHGSAR